MNGTNNIPNHSIIQLVNTLSVADGGPAVHAWELSQSLSSQNGFESQIFFLKGNYEESVAFRSASESANAHVRKPIKLDLATLFSRKRRPPILRVILKSHTWIIHGYFLIWVPAAAALGAIMGKRIVLIPHGSLTAFQSRHHRFRKRIWEATLGRLVRSRVLFFALGSEQERLDFLASFPASNALVIGVGTNMPITSSTLERVHDPVRLLSLSRIATKKRIELSIQATQLLRMQGLNAELTVAGDFKNSYGSQLRALTADLNLLDSVRFIGQVEGDRKISLLKNSDVFLLPSSDENFGIAVAEAAACGLPIIASNQVASAKLIESRACRVLEDCSPIAIATAVKQLLEYDFRELRKEVLICSEAFSWQSVAKRLIGALKSQTDPVGMSDDVR